MRNLTTVEVQQVGGGHPLVGGVMGAVGGGITEYSKGGNVGEIAFASAMGFATGALGGIAWAARSVYYGAAAVGMGYLSGMPYRDERGC